MNDAFGSSHRAHASVEAITKVLPQPAAGLLMEKEVQYLGPRARRARAAVRRDPRRREGVGQDRGHREPARAGGRAGDRRRDGLHVPQVARHADRQVAGRGRQARGGAGDHRARGTSGGVRLELPVDHVVDRRSSSRARRTRRSRWTIRRSATGWAWTSGPKTVGAVPARWWRARRRWSGTARWACSRRRRSTRAPTRWRRRWRRCTARRSSAAATRCRPSRRPAWPTGSRTSRRAAARRSSSSAAAVLPGVAALADEVAQALASSAAGHRPLAPGS